MKRKHIAKAILGQQLPGQGYYPDMPQISISVEGVWKLLSSLNPYKA
jgi:hypothetical protein